jgi:hypothetical protein
MPVRGMGILGLATLLLAGSGCCSFWERHCAPRATAVAPACVPCAPQCCPSPAYAPPAYAPTAAPTACPPCAPTGGQWQRQY